MTLRARVARERARLAAVIALAGGAAGMALALTALAAGALALGGGRWIAHPAAPLALWTAVLALLATVGALTARALRRRASGEAVAAAVERERGLRAGALRGAAEAERGSVFGRRAAAMMASRLEAHGSVLAPDALGRVRRSLAGAALAAVAALAVTAATAFAARDGWRAVRHPARALAGTLLPPIAILDAPSSVLRGDSVRVRIAAPGRARVTLRSRVTGAAWQERELAGAEAAAVLGPLDADLTLVATDGRAVSDTARVRVRDRAFVGDVAIEAEYPGYLARAAEALPAGEPMQLPRGTRLRIEARASTELAAAGLVREGTSDTLRFAVRGRRATAALLPDGSGRWRWFATGADGPVVDLPAPVEIALVADAPPRVEILAPAADTVLASDASVTLRIAASDDHGVAHLAMRSRREAAGTAMPEMVQEIAAPRAPEWAGEVPLDLAPRGLAPGDELRVVVVATDDSPWHQEGASRELVIRVPTLAESRALARALADSAASRTAQAAAAERDLAQRTAEAARARGDRGEGERAAPRAGMDYASAERAAALAKEQQRLADQVKAAEQQSKALEQALRASGALDTALARQLADAQQMLRDALTPEMMKQLEAVMSASKKLSPEETRRALEQLAKQQERLRAELERTAAMLKRAALEGAMQTLRDDARELAALGARVADSLAARAAAAPTAAAAVSDRARALSTQIAALGERLKKEGADAAAPRMPQAAAHASEGSEEMARAARAPASDAAPDGKAGAQALARAADDLAAAREAQVAAWKSGLTDELDKATSEAMELSRAEAELARDAAAGADSGLRGRQSAVQQGVERVTQRLDKAAGQSAHVSSGSQRSLGDARQRVADATREIAESRRAGRDAAPELQSAADALEQAAAQMMRDRAAVAGAQSASGFAEMMQRMAELAKQQGGINGQTAGLMPLPGAAPGAMAAGQARALARQQRALAQALDEIGGGDARAAQMAREMRDIAQQLDKGAVDPSLLQRQQQLFHRLLDAGLAMEKDEREDTGKRESRSAQAGPTYVPGSGARTGRAALPYGAPSWNELQSLSAEERQAVLDYFNRLNGAGPP